ncbi:MAG: hypothetical protein CVV09_14465 [Gammaproteobacteria bacterium HGW-Gammaproteobacteria-13]|nr:MAG: hypothetical protein CVV09_14465 [Gammaproteobacteria bacterium HGW-Gammaproteobacteria-13]
MKTGSECSCTKVHSASSPVFALHVSSSRDRQQVLKRCADVRWRSDWRQSIATYGGAGKWQG